MEVIRHGKYKSAVEPFLENKMSEANKEQTIGLIKLGLGDSLIADISKTRNISVATRLNEIANGLLARTPEMALKAQNLIDKIAYEDVYHADDKKSTKSC